MFSNSLSIIAELSTGMYVHTYYFVTSRGAILQHRTRPTVQSLDSELLIAGYALPSKDRLCKCGSGIQNSRIWFWRPRSPWLFSILTGVYGAR
jgi:hypothetical protein